MQFLICIDILCAVNRVLMPTEAARPRGSEQLASVQYSTDNGRERLQKSDSGGTRIELCRAKRTASTTALRWRTSQS